MNTLNRRSFAGVFLGLLLAGGVALPGSAWAGIACETNAKALERGLGSKCGKAKPGDCSGCAEKAYDNLTRAVPKECKDGEVRAAFERWMVEHCKQ